MDAAHVPQVCVCIPCYNYGRFLGAAIDSVVAQSMTDWQIVVSDNASTDDTAAVVERYRHRLGSQFIYHRNSRNLGALGNFNRCRQVASGKYLIFLCADDALHPTALESMVRALETHPTAAMAVASRTQAIDDQGNHVEAVCGKSLGPGLVSGREVLRAQCRISGAVGPPSQVLLRSASLGTGDLFDARFEQNCDNALWCSLCELWDVVYVPEALVYLRYHSATNTRQFMQTDADIRSRAALFGMLFRESPTLGGQRGLRYQFVQQRLYPWFLRALVAARHGDWRRSLWILGKIAAFSWVPWWAPYFLGVHLRSVLYCYRRRRRRLDRAVPAQ